MENKGSLLCSNSLMSTHIHSRMDPDPSPTSHISKIHFNITLTHILWSLKWHHPSTFSKSILVPNSQFHHKHHALQYYHCQLQDQHNNVQETPQIMKLCTVQVLQPPDTSYTLSSKYLEEINGSNYRHFINFWHISDTNKSVHVIWQDKQQSIYYCNCQLIITKCT